jgi:hypothetical protein
VPHIAWLLLTTACDAQLQLLCSAARAVHERYALRMHNQTAWHGAAFRVLRTAAASKDAALTQKPSGPVTPVASSKLMLMAELDLATCCTAFPAKLLGATNALAVPMTAATTTSPAFMMRVELMRGEEGLC